MGSVLLALPTFAAVLRQEPELVPAWAKLDAARVYRADVAGAPRTFGQMIGAYKAPVVGYEPLTTAELLEEAILEFRDNLSNPAISAEAVLGLQESLNELMAGQSLLGNDDLVKGLRVRFPGTGDPEDPDQLTLLTLSSRSFQEGIDAAVGDLRRDPDGLRARGSVNPQFPFFVENTVVAPGQGEVVENELYRFTNLVERAAVANNSIGKRLFFFGNVVDVDNFPFNNFRARKISTSTATASRTRPAGTRLPIN